MFWITLSYFTCNSGSWVRRRFKFCNWIAASFSLFCRRDDDPRRQGNLTSYRPSRPLRQYQLIPVPRRTWQCHHKHLHTTTDEVHCNETLSCPTINSRTQSNQTLNFVQWGQLPHCTTLGVKQTANMNPFLSVCQSWQQTRSHSHDSDLQRKCRQRSSKCRDPNLDATKAHKWHQLLWQEEVDLYHGCLAGLLKKCVLSQSLKVPGSIPGSGTNVGHYKQLSTQRPGSPKNTTQHHDVSVQSNWAYQTQMKQMQLVHCQPILVLHDWPSLVSHMIDLNRYQTLPWPW